MVHDVINTQHKYRMSMILTSISSINTVAYSMNNNKKKTIK